MPVHSWQIIETDNGSREVRCRWCNKPFPWWVLPVLPFEEARLLIVALMQELSWSGVEHVAS